MTTENWTYFANTNNGDGVILATVSPVFNDLGLGIDAWLIDDPDGNGRNNHRGTHAFTGAHYAQIDSGGYSARFNLRIEDYDTNRSNAMNINIDESHFTNGVGHRTSVFMRQNGSGDTVIQLQNDAAQTVEHTFTGDGGSYHTYDLRGDPTADTVDLYVDGSLTPVIAGFDISTPSSKGDYLNIGWDRYEKLAMYLNSFEFETAPGAVPEPTTLVLLTFGLAGLLAYPWRKRK